MRRRVALAAALCLALTACGPEGAPEPSLTPSPSLAPSPTQSAPTPTVAPTAQGDFVLPLDAAGGWNPYVGSRSGNMSLLPLLCEGLYALDDRFTPQGVLAREATASEGGLTWTVRLRQGVTFSDGTALTGQTVVKAVNAARSGDSLYAGRLKQITQVSAAGEDTVVFTLKSPNTRFTALLDFPLALVKGASVYGTGPYVLNGEELTAREDWWQGKTLPVSTIRLCPASDADQLMADFDDGALTLVAGDPTGTDTVGNAGRHQEWEYPTSTMLYLGFQCGKGLCRDQELRRLISRAVDRSDLVNRALSGRASVAILPVPPTSPDYDRTLADSEGYDPIAVADGLEELGYKLGEDGTRRKGKTALALTLVVNSDNAGKGEMAQIIAQELERMGIKVTVRALAWKDYQKALSDGRFDLYLGECRLTGDLDLTGFFTSGSGLYYGSCGSAELKEALAQARATGVWKPFYTLWLQEAPMTTLCFRTSSMLTQWGRVADATPTQNDLFYQFSSWTIW